MRARSTRYLARAKLPFAVGASMALVQVIIGAIHYGWTRDAVSFAVSRAPAFFLMGFVVNFLLNSRKNSN